MCNFWYKTFWVVDIAISSTLVDEKAKNIVGKKYFFEYLRYLQNWKYGDSKECKHEIIRRKRFLNDYRNLSNFSKFGYIFEKHIYLSSQVNYHDGEVVKIWRLYSKPWRKRSSLFSRSRGKVKSFSPFQWRRFGK